MTNIDEKQSLVAKEQLRRRTNQSSVSVRTHLMLALAVITTAIIASYTGVIPGGRHNLERIGNHLGNIFGEKQQAYEAVCSGHGVRLSSYECFCDIGFSGKDCAVSLKSVPATAIRPNSVLIVTDAFGPLIGSTTANTEHASAVDSAVLQNALAYEQLAVQLASQGVDVTVMYAGAENAYRFTSLQSKLANSNVRLVQLPTVPVPTGESAAMARSYAVYRYLTTPGHNVYSAVMAPSHSGLMYFTLKSRDQGLACFSQTKFISHVDALPANLLLRLENGDIEGKQLGVNYGGSAKHMAEVMKADFMAQKVTESSDAVVVGNEMFADYFVNELKWELNEERVTVIQDVPLLNKPAASNDAQVIEFVVVGTPYLSQAAGIKVMADALDQLKPRVSSGTSFRITFLGQSVELSSPKLLSEEFLDLRSYLWPTADWQIVSASSVDDILDYFAKTSTTKKIAVVPHIVSATGSSSIVQNLVSNGVPILAARTALTETAVLYDAWSRVFFQSNNSRSLSDKLLQTLRSGASSIEPAQMGESIANSPAEIAAMWADRVFAPLFEASKNADQCASAGFQAIDVELPTVSIVLVHHDRPEFVKQALKSIESQDYPQDKLEVILVDDGSTDPVAVQFINDLAWQWWETKGWKVVREPQRWLGAARNTGVRYAKGSYIIFMDDDDVSKPHKISTFVQAALSTDADVVSAGHDVFNSEKYPQTVSGASATVRFIPLGSAVLAGMFENVFGDSSFMVKRSFFIDFGGFTEDFGVGFEDYEFLAKVALDPNARLETIPESLTWYRKIYNGKSMTDNTELKENQARFMRPYVERYPFQSATEQSLLRFVQSQLFARDEHFSSALLNTTVIQTGTIPTTFVLTTQEPSTTTQLTTTEMITTDTTTTTTTTTDVKTTTDTKTTTAASTTETTKSTETSTQKQETTSQPPETTTLQGTTTLVSTITEAKTTQAGTTTFVASTTTTIIPVPTGCPTALDACGVCGGNNSTCTDCAGVLFGTAKRDNCGVCNGDSSTCFKIIECKPRIVAKTGIQIVTVVGGGFRIGDQVKIGNYQVPALSVTFYSSSVILLAIDAEAAFGTTFAANPDVPALDFAIQLINGQQSSNMFDITAINRGGHLTSVAPTSALIETRTSFAINGENLLNFTTSGCVFRYRSLEWNADFTRQVLVEATQVTAATFVSSTQYTCQSPLLQTSSEANVTLTYFAETALPITIGAVTLRLSSFTVIPQNSALTVTFVAPAPVIVESAFDRSGFFATIVFDSATNGISFNGRNCSDLFVVNPASAGLDTSVYARLSDGNPRDCRFTFVNPRTLQLSVSAEFAARNPLTALVPGKRVRFIGGIIRRLNQLIANAFSGDSLPFAAPQSPEVPDVQLNMPQFLGVCAPLSVDLSASRGSGGRFFSFAEFTAVASETSTANKNSIEAALNPLLAQFASEVPSGKLFFNLPATTFPGRITASIRFSFTLRNFLGASSTRTFTLFLDTNTLIPVIKVQGPSSGFAQRSSRVKLSGLLTLPQDPACLAAVGISSDGGYTLSWNQTAPADQLNLFRTSFVSPSGSEITIPQYTYQQGHTYSFAYIVRARTGETYVTNYDLTYQYGRLNANIDGGSRTSGNDQDLVFSASIADDTWIDNTELASHLNEYTFTWACELVAADGTTSQCLRAGTLLPITLPSGQSITIDRSFLAPVTGGDFYRIIVIVSHGISSRTSRDSIALRLVNGRVPGVRISSNKNSPIATDKTFFLSSTVQNVGNPNNVEYFWSSLPTCEGESFNTIDLSDSRLLSSRPGSSILSFQTSPPSLAEGGKYCIQLAVKDPENPSRLGFAQFKFNVRRQPAFGSCNVVGNSTGRAFETRFEFSCGQWSTDPLSGDIYYQFSYVSSQGVHTLGPRSKNGVQFFRFGAVGTYEIQATITDDANGVSAEKPTFIVTVLPGSISADQAAEESRREFEKTMNTASGLGDMATGLQGLGNGNTRTKRQVGGNLQKSLLDFLTTIVSQTSLDYVDIGPTVAAMLRDVVNAGSLTAEVATAAVDLLSKLAADMNRDGRTFRSCFTPVVAADILSSLDKVMIAAQGIASFNSTTLVARREPILKTFTSCLQRVSICGGNSLSVSSAETQITYGQVSAAAQSGNFGVFNVSGLNNALGTSDCVQYRYDQGTRFLPEDTNATIGNTVYTLEFTDAQLNAGGPRATADSYRELTGTFNPPITFYLPLDPAQKVLLQDETQQPFCKFYVRTQFGGFWSTDGCAASLAGERVMCSCTHLTEFAISVQANAPVVGPNPENPTTPGAAAGSGSIAGPVSGAIIAAIVVGVVGIATYRRVQKKQAQESARIAPVSDAKMPLPGIQASETTRTDAIVEETETVDMPAPIVKKTRDPSTLPPYQLPPSYDDHLRLKGQTSEASRAEKISRLEEETRDVAALRR